jgi:hypothetical protein
MRVLVGQQSSSSLAACSMVNVDRLKIRYFGRYGRFHTLITPSLTIAHALWLPDTPSPSSPRLWLVVTRHLFAGAPATLREGGRISPISVAGATSKSITKSLRSPTSRSDPSSPSP